MPMAKSRGCSDLIRKILVPVRGDGKGDLVLAHAASLGRRFTAHIDVVHCRARPEDLMPFGVPLSAFARDTFIKQAQQLADVEEKGLREELTALAQTLGLSETDAPHGDAATVSFVESQGRMADVIKTHGRLADLVAVPKPDRDRNVGSNSLKSALFQTGRPVLMTPPSEPAEDLGTRVAIGWNGSMEAARAVAQTESLLAGAESVTILRGGSLEPHGASTEELVQYYALRGVKAGVHRFDAQNPGADLLREAKTLGANLLVMGAYGDSHERETLFGGNTQLVVDTADIPVVLVH